MPAPPRRRVARARGPLLLILLQGVVLAGCGSTSHGGNGVAGKSPHAIPAAAQAASDAARSVHVRGSIEGAKAHESFDIEILARRGTRGTVTAGGASFELIETAGTVYRKGEDAVYE